jgi:hypothetical protein
MQSYPNDPRFRAMIDWLNGYRDDLWNNLDKVPDLPDAVGLEVIGGFLELACKSQHIGNITFGRQAIWALPREWTIERIEQVAESALDLHDEWEYRRLLEVLDEFDERLFRRFIARGLESDNQEIQEAAQDMQ